MPSPAAATRRRLGWLVGPGIVVALVITFVVTATGPLRPFSAADARRIGLPVVLGDTLFRPDGTRTALRLPPGDTIGQLAIVPAGLLALVYHRHAEGSRVELAVRLRRANGVWEEFATSVEGDFAITSDGGAVVIDSPGELRSIDLATSSQLHTIQDGSWSLVSLNGDWALLTSGRGDNEIWNVRTGAVVPFATVIGVTPFGVTAGGQVLRGVMPDPQMQGDTPPRVCLDVVPPVGSGRAITVPTSPTGACGAFDLADANVSPDGTWVAFMSEFSPSGVGAMVLRTAELHRGTWAPVRVHETHGTVPLRFWDSPTTFIAQYVADGGGNGYERCSVDGRCRDLDVPGNAVIGAVVGR
ncbi:MAG TPA: hypothetical protein VH442_07490 [Micromonosporaceae bacterium]